jgi:hypothetical protein
MFSFYYFIVSAKTYDMHLVLRKMSTNSGNLPKRWKNQNISRVQIAIQHNSEVRLSIHSLVFLCLAVSWGKCSWQNSLVGFIGCHFHRFGYIVDLSFWRPTSSSLFMSVKRLLQLLNMFHLPILLGHPHTYPLGMSWTKTEKVGERTPPCGKPCSSTSFLLV